MNYVFANGYLIVHVRALVDQALRYHDSGSTLTHSPIHGGPAGGRQREFLGAVYHNLVSAGAAVC